MKKEKNIADFINLTEYFNLKNQLMDYLLDLIAGYFNYRLGRFDLFMSMAVGLV